MGWGDGVGGVGLASLLWKEDWEWTDCVAMVDRDGALLYYSGESGRQMSRTSAGRSQRSEECRGETLGNRMIRAW